MEWKRKARKLRPLLSFSSSCGLLTWQSQGLASSGQNVSLNQNFLNFFLFLTILWCPFDHGRLHSAWHCAWHLKSATFQSLLQISISLIIIWFCFKPANKLVFLTYIINKKLRKRESKAVLHKLVESVQILWELILLQKKKVRKI